MKNIFIAVVFWSVAIGISTAQNKKERIDLEISNQFFENVDTVVVQNLTERLISFSLNNVFVASLRNNESKTVFNFAQKLYDQKYEFDRERINRTFKKLGLDF